VLPAEIHTALLERAGGNPLYAEEFIRMLSDRGILRQQGRVMSLQEDVEIPVPESVHALIAARLDTLSNELKSLLQDASVAGKVFWSGAVAAIGGTDNEATRHGLHELGAKELVRPSRTSSMEGQQEYVFWHALIRDVCYGQIPRAARARKHQSMAVWIERTAERLDDHAEVLAHHYSTALELATASGTDDVGDLEAQTRRFLIVAADRAASLDPAKALSLYRRALGLLAPDDPETLKVLREAGKACRSLGLFAEGRSYLERAVTGFAERGDWSGEANALRRLSLLFRDHGHTDEGRTFALKAVELLEQHAPGEELSLACAGLAFFEVALGSLEKARAWTDRAVDVAHSSSREALSEALQWRGIVRCESGELGGIEDLKAAKDIDEATGDAFATAVRYNNLGTTIWLIDGPREALELMETAREIGHSHGFTPVALWAHSGALFMLFDLGRWSEVLQQADDLITLSKRHGLTVI
jgi:tetratricopeptide (TPR) repeat protein